MFRKLVVFATAALALIGCGGDPDLLDEEEGAGREAMQSGRILWVDGVAGRDSNPGTFAAPFQTINKGLLVMQSGDTLKVKQATYHEQLRLTKPRTIIEAADPMKRPVLDGRYGPGLFGMPGYKDYCGHAIGANDLPSPTEANRKKGGWVIAGASKTLVSLLAPGVTFRGFVVRNVAGRAVGIQADDCVVEDVRADFTNGGSVYVLGSGASKVHRARLTRVVITRSSMKFFDPSRTGSCSPEEGGPELVQGTLQIKFGKDITVEDCTVAYNYAEGISAAKESENVVIRRNTIHTNNHVHLYAVGGQNTRAYENMVFFCQNHKEVSRGDVIDGIVIGDENKTGTLPTVSGAWYNNLVVGMKRALQVRNGPAYRTVLKNAYFGYNTFVSSSDTLTAVEINSPADTTHSRTLFENNLMVGYPGRPIAKANRPLGGVRFRNNLWSQSPPPAFLGEDSIVQAPGLVSPQVPIQCEYDVRSLQLPDPTATTFDPRNYALRSHSPAVGEASNRSPANGVTPPTVTTDIFGQLRTNAGPGRFFDIGADEL
jgi:hypothetical protein